MCLGVPVGLVVTMLTKIFCCSILNKNLCCDSYAVPSMPLNKLHFYSLVNPQREILNAQVCQQNTMWCSAFEKHTNTHIISVVTLIKGWHDPAAVRSVRLCLSTQPFIFLYPWSGHRSNRTRREAQTSLSGSSWGILRHSQVINNINPPVTSMTALRFPEGRAQKTSDGRDPGVFLIKCLNHLSWLRVMWRSSGTEVPSDD